MRLAAVCRSVGSNTNTLVHSRLAPLLHLFLPCDRAPMAVSACRRAVIVSLTAATTNPDHLGCNSVAARAMTSYAIGGRNNISHRTSQTSGRLSCTTELSTARLTLQGATSLKPDFTARLPDYQVPASGLEIVFRPDPLSGTADSPTTPGCQCRRSPSQSLPGITPRC